VTGRNMLFQPTLVQWRSSDSDPMIRRRIISFCLLAVLSFIVTGCKKKTAKVIPPPPSLPEPSAFLRPLPVMIAQLMRATVYPPEPVVAEIPPVEPTKKPKPRHRPRPVAPTVAQAPPATPAPSEPAAVSPAGPAGSPPRITIDRPQPGGTVDITPVLDHSEEAHRRQSTEQLLQSTEDALHSITRNLTEEEHAIVAQIRNFMTQSRAATAENDVVRAHNLALKAHLLSDELVRH